jgi:hypothetical protein
MQKKVLNSDGTLPVFTSTYNNQLSTKANIVRGITSTDLKSLETDTTGFVSKNISPNIDDVTKPFRLTYFMSEDPSETSSWEKNTVVDVTGGNLNLKNSKPFAQGWGRTTGNTSGVTPMANISFNTDEQGNFKGTIEEPGIINNRLESFQVAYTYESNTALYNFNIDHGTMRLDGNNTYVMCMLSITGRENIFWDQRKSNRIVGYLRMSSWILDAINQHAKGTYALVSGAGFSGELQYSEPNPKDLSDRKLYSSAVMTLQFNPDIPDKPAYMLGFWTDGEPWYQLGGTQGGSQELSISGNLPILLRQVSEG